MFTDDTLKRYLESIDSEKALSTERVISLYKYGFILEEEQLDKLKIHDGFQNTIRRYIENKNTLTKQDLLCILKLYTLEFPESTILLPPQLIEILSIPKPIVTIDTDDIIQISNITYIPHPVITIDVGSIQSTISFIPKPIVSSEFEGAPSVTSIPKPIVEVFFTAVPGVTYIPKPIVGNIELAELPSTITFIPKPIVRGLEFTGTTYSYVAAPYLKWGELPITLPTITYIPKPVIEIMEPEIIQTGSYFFGFTGVPPSSTIGQAEPSRSTELNNLYSPATIQEMLTSTSYQTGIIQEVEITESTNLNILPCVGWTAPLPWDATDVQYFPFVFYLLPVAGGVLPRTSWFMSGGSQAIPGELFPNPETTPITIDGEDYLLTFSNTRTSFGVNTVELRRSGGGI